ncbi:MAG TPA: hypothetical protein VJH34_01550 [archaeon]|nr:hypothetical protein [archaeon]
MKSIIYVGIIVIALFLLVAWMLNLNPFSSSSITAAPVKSVEQANNAVISMSYSIDQILSTLESIDSQIG